MVFSGSMEFEKSCNQEVKERPSDNVELPRVSICFLCIENKICFFKCSLKKYCTHLHLSPIL